MGVGVAAMKRTALIAVLLPIAVAAIAVPASAVLAVDRNAARIPGLQSLADASCACARAAPDAAAENACWRRFERLARVNHREPTGGTACYPLSQTMIGVPGTPSSVTLNYGVVASDGLYLCTKEEAVVGEAIWYREAMQGTETDLNRTARRADAALIRFAEALKRGEPLARLRPEAGCVTGHM